MEFLVSLWEFLVNQKKIWLYKKFFGIPKKNLVDQKKFWYTKNKFSGPKIPRDCPKIPWDWTIFFGRPKKNEKKTGQLVDQETDQNHMDGTNIFWTWTNFFNHGQKWYFTL